MPAPTSRSIIASGLMRPKSSRRNCAPRACAPRRSRPTSRRRRCGGEAGSRGRIGAWSNRPARQQCRHRHHPRRRRSHRGRFRPHHPGQFEIRVSLHAGRAASMRGRKWGRIVNISSGAARGAGAIGPHYNASKAGMEGLTRGYAARLVKEGITVNAVAPSLIETDMMKRPARSGSRIPLGRFGHPGRSRPGRDDGDRQRLHDRADHRAQRRHDVQLR